MSKAVLLPLRSEHSLLPSLLCSSALISSLSYSPAPEVEVLTSGSTAIPKKLKAVKERMRASAAMTIAHLGLTEGCSALLCMPLEHIAGKMMVMRAVLGKMALAHKPSAAPFEKAPCGLDFAALTPMQAYCTLQNEDSVKRLATCRNIIVGGFIEPELERRLSALPGHFYHSYGMTETLSHIALRPHGRTPSVL